MNSLVELFLSFCVGVLFLSFIGLGIFLVITFPKTVIGFLVILWITILGSEL
jgi:hypothetical protein